MAPSKLSTGSWQMRQVTPAFCRTSGMVGHRNAAFRWPTIPEVLQKAGVTWRICQDPVDNFEGAMHGCLPFQSFRDAQSDHSSPLFKNGMTPWTVEDMKKDVLANKLPEVVWVLPSEPACEHPDSSSPVQGGHFIQQV